MPKITDKRVIQGKKNRNNDIRKHFNKRFAEGFRYEVIEEEVILKFGVSATVITRILKERDDQTN